MNSMNKIRDNITAALSSLLSNTLRALLTTFGIGIGIASVIVLVSLGGSVQNYVNKQFLSAGSDLIYVAPAAAFGSNVDPNAQRLSASLTERDLALVQDPFNVPDVKAVVPVMQVPSTVDYGSNETQVSGLGTSANYFDTLNRTVASGRLFDDDDMNSNARVAVLGQTTVQNLFPPNTSPIGESIRVGDVPFRVIGTLQKSGGGFGGTDQDNLIVVPITAAEAHLQTGRSVSGDFPLSEIYLQAQTPDAADYISQTVVALLHQSHKIKPGKDNDFQVTTEKDFLSSLNAVIGVLTIFLSVIGGISLLVGGVGVMNIMLVTVTERTHEIGLRKAVGARALDVLFQFLTEAVVMCFVGGFVGLVVAVLGILVIGLAIPDLGATISPSSIVLAISVTSLVGLFFGIYPASRAAVLSPIVALRTE